MTNDKATEFKLAPGIILPLSKEGEGIFYSNHKNDALSLEGWLSLRFTQTGDDTLIEEIGCAGQSRPYTGQICISNIQHDSELDIWVTSKLTEEILAPCSEMISRLVTESDCIVVNVHVADGKICSLFPEKISSEDDLSRPGNFTAGIEIHVHNGMHHETALKYHFIDGKPVKDFDNLFSQREKNKEFVSTIKICEGKPVTKRGMDTFRL